MNPRLPDAPFELRVLEGEQQGARSPVLPGVPLTVSAALDSDVVLRAADFGERRIQLTAGADGVQLSVLHGEVQVGEQRVAAGEQRRIDLGERVQLGSTAIGIGLADQRDWSLATLDATHAAATAAPADDAPPPAAAAVATAPARRWWQWLVAGGGALAAVSMGMLAFALNPASAPPDSRQRIASTEAALQAAGLPALAVRSEADGGLVVSGHLASAAQRARVEQLLVGAPAPVRLEVWVDDQVANAVLDVYRVNGVPATAHSSGRGAVAVETREADAARLDRVNALARRDVPGLTALEVHNVPPPAPRRAAAPVIDDPGKRVASIVSGHPPDIAPYVVTADGTRYFEGALLPTGHRIASIGQHEVVLEKDGEKTPLVF